MPIFKHQTTLGITCALKAFLRLEAGLTRSQAPDRDLRLARALADAAVQGQRAKRLSRKLAEKEREIAALGGKTERIPETSRNSPQDWRALEGRKDLKLHLGAGKDVKPGWVNVDLSFKPRRGVDDLSDSDTVMIEHDLRRGLPVQDESCAYIYSSHFFEHLEYGDGLRLMRDCHRALRPGGVFRVALPVFKDLFSRYLQVGEGPDLSAEQSAGILKRMPDLEPDTETMVDWINYGVYQNGEHKYIYDEKKIMLLLRKLGYSSVIESEYTEGVDPDTEIRRRYSFYVEAVK